MVAAANKNTAAAALKTRLAETAAQPLFSRFLKNTRLWC